LQQIGALAVARSEEFAMKTLLIAAALAALASTAIAQPPPPRQCFTAREIDNTTVVDDSTINFTVGRRVYQVKMAGACPHLKDSFRGFTMDLQGSDQICGPLDLNITVNDIAARHCIAQSLRQLSPAEAAALSPKRKR
jgi:hypothetical protein